MLEVNEKLIRVVTETLCTFLIEEIRKAFTSKRSRRTGPSKFKTKPLALRVSLCLDNRND